MLQTVSYFNNYNVGVDEGARNRFHCIRIKIPISICHNRCSKSGRVVILIELRPRVLSGNDDRCRADSNDGNLIILWKNYFHRSAQVRYSLRFTHLEYYIILRVYRYMA